MVQVVALAGTFAHACEDAETTMTFGDVIDQLLNNHGLADTGPTEGSNLSTFHKGADQVDHLDACFKWLNAR